MQGKTQRGALAGPQIRDDGVMPLGQHARDRILEVISVWHLIPTSRIRT
jgi:hypothetical protein